MATEQGIVTEVRSEGTALVKTVRSEACKACASSGSCSGAGNDRQVEVLNPIGATAGDRIVLRIESGAFLKAVFLLYMVPVLALLAGAGAGQHLGPRLGMDPSGASMIAALAGFAAAVLFVRHRGQRMAGQRRYRPRIVRILRRAS